MIRGHDDPDEDEKMTWSTLDVTLLGASGLILLLVVLLDFGVWR